MFLAFWFLAAISGKEMLQLTDRSLIPLSDKCRLTANSGRCQRAGLRVLEGDRLVVSLEQLEQRRPAGDDVERQLTADRGHQPEFLALATS